jgi:Ca2+-binding EF-hand superfamily protein
MEQERMAMRKTQVLALASWVLMLAGCQGGMPLMARTTAPVAAPQTRAASVDGFKARIRQAMETEFVARDADKNKYLTPAEARMPTTEFRRADKNTDGKLDPTELLEYLHRDLYGPFNQKMVPVFKGLDVNASNFLEEAEFAQVTLTSTGPDGQPLRPTQLLYRVADRNRDFRVDYDEFEDLMAWDEANLLPEYFRSPAAPAPVAKPPAAPQPAPVAPQPPAAAPVVANPHVQAPGEPPRPDPEF